MPLDERFWSKVDKRGPNECWPWRANCDRLGYGRFTYTRQKHVTAHRMAFFLTHGHWPEPACLHSCDNRPCCNPAHLREGTHTDNMQDKVQRGRSNPQRGEQHHAARLTEAQILEARTLRETGVRLVDLAKRYDVSISTIARALRGETWAVLPAYTSKVRRGGEAKRGEAHPLASISEETVLRIRELAAQGVTRRDLKERFGLSKSQIQRIVTGASWSHVP